MSGVSGASRHRARVAALQMLYQWEVGKVSPHEAVVTYWPSRDADDEIDEEGRAFANALSAAAIQPKACACSVCI